MAFKLVDGHWLATQTRKASNVFKVHLEDDTEYTQEGLIAVLAAHGQVLSVPEFQQVRAELVRLGVIEGEEDSE